MSAFSYPKSKLERAPEFFDLWIISIEIMYWHFCLNDIKSHKAYIILNQIKPFYRQSPSIYDSMKHMLNFYHSNLILGKELLPMTNKLKQHFLLIQDREEFLDFCTGVYVEVQKVGYHFPGQCSAC